MYLEKQKLWKENKVIRIGYCSVSEGRKREQGIWFDYLNLSSVIEEAGISEKHVSNFIQALRIISYRHGTSIPLPTEYRSLKRTVVDNLNDRMLPIRTLKLKYPKEMFADSDKMSKMSVVFIDLMLLVADQMGGIYCKDRYI